MEQCLHSPYKSFMACAGIPFPYMFMRVYMYCSRTFFIYLYLRLAGVSYGRFIDVRFGFDLSAYVQNRWRNVGGEIFKRRNGWEQLTDASSPTRKQSRVWCKSECREVTVSVS